MAVHHERSRLPGCGCFSGLGCLTPVALLGISALVFFLLPLNLVLGEDNVCGSAPAAECARETYQTIQELLGLVDGVGETLEPWPGDEWDSQPGIE